MEYWIGLALAPAVVLMWVIYVSDRYEPEPRGLVMKVLGLGALAALPVIVVELAVSPWFGNHGDKTQMLSLAAFTFLGVAVPEEFFKWLVVMVVIYRHPEFDEPYDGVVYCVASSLGFAALENVLYVVGAGSSNVAAGLAVGILRALLSVPAHTIFGATMGYCVGRARFTTVPAMRGLWLFLSMLIPVGFHGLYDLFCLSGQLGMTFGLVLVTTVMTVAGCLHLQTLSPFRQAPQDEFGRPRLRFPFWPVRPGPYPVPWSGGPPGGTPWPPPGAAPQQGWPVPGYPGAAPQQQGWPAPGYPGAPPQQQGWPAPGYPGAPPQQGCPAPGYPGAPPQQGWPMPGAPGAPPQQQGCPAPGYPGAASQQGWPTPGYPGAPPPQQGWPAPGSPGVPPPQQQGWPAAGGFCPQCGSPLAPEVSFCSRCGGAVRT